MNDKTTGRTFHVGDRVRLRFGPKFVTGTIVEDRGFIGVGGRRLWTIQAEFDQTNTLVMEVPEEELTAAK
jgi:hypothetical protein